MNHYYASSVAQWATTNDKRDLAALRELMQSDGFPFVIYKVPGHWYSDYTIDNYAPKVKGAAIVERHT
jgi:hypothetical protein